MKRFLVVFLGIIIFIVPEISLGEGCADLDNDDKINILDVVYLINFIYKNGPDPDCGLEMSTMTDYDGNTYYTVKIGEQWWMAENLKVTHYRDGSVIPHVNDASWSSADYGAYCEYMTDENYVAGFGRLYNWFAVDDSRNIAPEGWHVPSNAEWQTLVDYLGGDAVAGGKMKETGTASWISPNTGATDESGFHALPGGLRYDFGAFAGMGSVAWFWSSTESYSDYAWIREMTYNYAGVNSYDMGDKNNGMAIRCVKD